ncbi:AAA family ATPase [Kluyvera intermedia]|uniref:AAA family ATPase n=1 Tax=Kluyvera intermedia TaxID=61648 RepID=UPI0035235057
MLTKFSGSNYKAFRNFSFDIKPLTILLGANSCGKSSLINSLLMFSQTMETAHISESALRLNGNKVGMGESLNVIREKNPKNILTFSFEFSDTALTRREIFNAKREFMEFIFLCTRLLGQYFRQNKQNEEITKLSNEIESNYMYRESYNSIQLKHISSNFCDLLEKFRALPIDDNKNLKFHHEKLITFFKDASIEKVQNSLIHLASLGAKKMSPTRVEYQFIYNKKEDKLRILECTFFNILGEKFINIGFSKGKFILKSDVIKRSALSKSRDEISSMINFDSLYLVEEDININFIDKYTQTADPFASLFCKLLTPIIKKIVSEFSYTKINHVSPLRAFPQRYYLLDKSIQHSHLNALEGTELAEILKKNPDIKKKINLLLAKFNLAVDVVKVNDIIHKINITQDSIDLELTDVGFGISQALPILVQAYLSPKKSITIIEQPEIHLHPKMQAWLTDALINIALKEDKRFVIETHSDALIRRIRLRIVDEKSALQPSDVLFCNLERNSSDSSTSLKTIPITEDGDITWPADFLDVEINDTIKIQQLKVEKYMKNKGIQ